MSGPIVGVDLGGTNIRAASATGATSHGEPVKRLTPAAAGPQAVIDAVVATVLELTGGTTPAGVAIGIPGPLDPEAGVVYAAPHLAGWTDVPARELLRSGLGCDVTVHNDAVLAGYAEWLAGAGSGARNLVFVTASTGIGGCLIIDGRLYSGTAGTAGELGHVPAGLTGPACPQGHAGCLDGVASGTAMANTARERLAAGEGSALSTLNPAQIDAVAILGAARGGDALAVSLYTTAGRALGRAIGGLINMLSPEVVVLGGGLINAGEALLEPVRSGVAEIAFAEASRRCRIVSAGLGTDAGLVGATAWAVRTFGLPSSSPG